MADIPHLSLRDRGRIYGPLVLVFAAGAYAFSFR